MMYLRRWGRLLGINKILIKFISSANYEGEFDEELSKCIRNGDCVWDVGANVGFYTKQFSQMVGDKGKVFAFEPSAVNYNKLTKDCELLSNAYLFNFGLGDKEEKIFFKQGADELGATSRIVAESESDDQVEIKVGEDLVTHRVAEVPNVVKIDVEGYEWEVVDGLKGFLQHHELRTIGIEVHFRLLQLRKKSDTPAKLESLLRQNGFKITWTDPSHLIASKAESEV